MLGVILSAFLCAGCDDGSVVTIKIKGKVFSLEDSSAIRNAIVFAVNKADGQSSDMAVTGADGSYEVEIEATREGRKKPVSGSWELNVSAEQYMAVPSFIRPSIAIKIDNFIPEENRNTYSDTLTDIGLAPLNESEEIFTVSGSVEGGETGALVVLEGCNEAPCPYGYTAKRGAFTIFNVKQGNYSTAAYKKDFSYEPTAVEISEDMDNVVVNKKLKNIVMAATIQPTPKVQPRFTVWRGPGPANIIPTRGDIHGSLSVPGPPGITPGIQTERYEVGGEEEQAHGYRMGVAEARNEVMRRSGVQQRDLTRAQQRFDEGEISEDDLRDQITTLLGRQRIGDLQGDLPAPEGETPTTLPDPQATPTTATTPTTEAVSAPPARPRQYLRDPETGRGILRYSQLTGEPIYE